MHFDSFVVHVCNERFSIEISIYKHSHTHTSLIQTEIFCCWTESTQMEWKLKRGNFISQKRSQKTFLSNYTYIFFNSLQWKLIEYMKEKNSFLQLNSILKKGTYAIFNVGGKTKSHIDGYRMVFWRNIFSPFLQFSFIIEYLHNLLNFLHACVAMCGELGSFCIYAFSSI